MQLGLIGLGKMGGNMRERLRRAGHEVVGFDRNPDVSDVGTPGRAWSRRSTAPRVVWVMVPAGAPTRETVAKLADLLDQGDLVIDGGNSRFTDDFENAKLLGAKGIGYVDCGVSGGIWGLENGYGLMVGGDDELRRAGHADLRRAAPRGPARGGLRPRRQGRRRPLHEDGPQRHRVRPDAGLRRGLRAARDEGHRHRRARRASRPGAAAPSCAPGCSTCWSRRSRRTRTSTDVSGYTADSGEGRWTVEEAIANSVPMPVISASLFARFASRQDDSPDDEGRRGAARPVRRARGRRGRGCARGGPRPAPRPSRQPAATSVDTAAKGRGRHAGRVDRHGRRRGRRPATDPEGTERARPAPVRRRLPQLRRAPSCRSTPGVTTLVGLNGQGKTNLVEAVGYLATLGSHRVATDAPLVRFGAAAGGHPRRGRARRARDDGRARDHPGPGQPGPARPLAGDPAARRARHAAHRALRARGPRPGQGRPVGAAPVPRRPARRAAAALGRGARGLRQGAQAAQRPAEVGRAGAAPGRPRPAAARATSRSRTPEPRAAHPRRLERPPGHGRRRSCSTPGCGCCATSGPTSPRRTTRSAPASPTPGSPTASSLREDGGRAIAAGEVPEIEELHDEILATLEQVRASEVERGVSLVGPHRDDLVLTLGELPAKGYASHGESWSFALGLRLAAYQLLRHDLGDDPVLILDDVFAELDTGPARAAGGAGRRLRAGAHHRGGRRRTCPTSLTGEHVPGDAGRGGACRVSTTGRRTSRCEPSRCGRPCRTPGRGDPADAGARRSSATRTPRRRAALARARAAARGQGAAARAAGRSSGAGRRRAPSAAPAATAATPRCSATRWTGCCSTAAGRSTSRSASVMGRWAADRRAGRGGALHPGDLRRRRPHRAGRLHRLGHPAAAAVLLDPGPARGRGRQGRRVRAEGQRPGRADLGRGSRRGPRARGRATPTADLVRGRVGRPRRNAVREPLGTPGA